MKSTTHPVSVRNASSANIDAVLELLRDANLPSDDVPGIFGESFGVAIVDDSIVGVAGIERHGNVGLFRSVAVRGDLRGKGIGEALTLNRVEWAKSHGITELYLLTTTAADYFPRYGFEVIARDDAPEEIATTAEFTSLCPSSATAMRLRLKEKSSSANG